MTGATSIKVAVVSDAVHPWHTGGKETRWRYIIDGLVERGIEVEVHTMRWWDGPAPQHPVRHRALTGRHPLYRNGKRSIGQAVRFAIGCCKLITTDADIIDADQMPGIQLPVLRLIATVRRKPLVVTWHEMWGATVWRAYLGRAGNVAAAIEYVGTRCADRIIAVSPATASALAEHGVPAKRITCIDCGVAVDDVGGATGGEPRGAGPGPLRLVHVGRLVAHKRCDVAIDAVAELRERGIDVVLDVVGDGPERSALEAHAAMRGVAAVVNFHGRVEADADVHRLTAAADVCVAPSEREGFGIVVAEALALGVPVVVSDHAENASTALIDTDRTGYVVAAGDGAAFADGIERARQLRDVATTFRAMHPELTWDRAVDSTIAVYHELLRGRR